MVKDKKHCSNCKKELKSMFGNFTLGLFEDLKFKSKHGYIPHFCSFKCRSIWSKKEIDNKKLDISVDKNSNRAGAILMGLIVGGPVAHFFAIPMINMFFKLTWISKTIVYVVVIFMGIGLASILLTGHTALNKMAHQNKTDEALPIVKSNVDKIKELKELKDSGAITEQEFKSKKKKLLEKI